MTRKMPRRLFRFSLRTLLLLPVAVAVLGWLAWPWLSWRMSVARIRSAGGTVTQGGCFVRGGVWAYSGEIWSVDFNPYTSNIDSRTLASLVPDLRIFPELELIVPLTRVRQDDLAKLVHLSNLRVLCVGSPHLTDDGLRHIGRMTSLRLLWIGSPQVTDAGLIHLRGLKKLELLMVSCPRVTESGVRRLIQHLPRLQYVNYPGGSIGCPKTIDANGDGCPDDYP